MKVGGIFKTLITIVACVVIGAFALNILLPNATKSLVNATEDMLYNATSMSFNFNGDDHAGGAYTAGTEIEHVSGAENDNVKGNVKGFGSSEGKNNN